MRKYGYHSKKHAELWAWFRENIAKLLGRTFNISKVNFQLEMKVLNMCYIEILGQRTYKFCWMILLFLKMIFALRNYGYSCHHVCGIMVHIFSDICRIMGPNFEPKWHVPVQN